MPSRVSENIIRWVTDTQSVNKTVQQAERVAAAQREVLQTQQVSRGGAPEVDMARARATDDLIGRADTASSALGTLANTMGLAGGEALNFGADVLASVEAVGNFRTTLATMQASSIAASGQLGALGSALGSGVGIAGVAAVAAIAVVALAAVMSDFIQGMNEQAAQLKAALEASAGVTRDIAAGMTTEEAESRAEELRKLIDAEETNLQRAQDAYSNLNDQLKTEFGSVGGEIVGALVRTFDNREEELTSAVNASRDELADLNAELGALEGVLNDTSLAANDAAVAQAAATQELINESEQAAQTEIERARILQTASVAGAEQSIKLMEAEAEARARQIESLKAAGDESEDVAEEIARLEREHAGLTDTLEFYRTTVLQTAQANEDAAAAEQARAEAAAQDAAERERIAAQEKAEREKQIEENKAFMRKQREEVAAVAEKYNRDVENIEQQTADRRASLNQRYADQLVSIAEKAAEDSEAALRDLQQKRTELFRDNRREEDRAARDFQRGETDARMELQREEARAARDAQREMLDMQIDAQREEARAYRDHAKRMARARREQELEEFFQIANRDFAALFETRARGQLRETEAGEDFAAQRSERQRVVQEAVQDAQRRRQAEAQERAIAEQERRQDAIRQFNAEREERAIELRQSLQDAQQAYEIERAQIAQQRSRALQQAEIAHRRDLHALNRQTQERLQVRQQAAVEELRIAMRGAQERVQIEQRTQQALVQQAFQMLGRIQGMGNMAAGMNPMQQIFNQGRQLVTNLTQNISGADPRMVAGTAATLAANALRSVLQNA